MKRIANVLRKSGLPALVARKSGTAEEVNFRPYRVQASTEEATVLLGGTVQYSPIDGEQVSPLTGGQVVASSEEDLASRFPVIAHCDCCNHDILAPRELAAQMDGVAFHCIACGEELSADYFGDLDELASEDGEEDMEDEDTMEVDDTSSDEDIVDEVEDDPEDTSEDDSEDVSEEEAADDMEDVPDEDMEDNEEDMGEEEDESSEDYPEEEEAADIVTVVSASFVADSSEIRLIQAHSKRWEVFAGDTHLGHLDMEKASANVVELSKNVDTFRRSAIMVLAKDLSEIKAKKKPSTDAATFGLSLATVEVPVAQPIAEIVEQQVEDTVSEVIRVADETVTAHLKALEIAFAGLNKGILKGPSLVMEVAKVLRRYGCVSPVEEANKVLSSVTEQFLKTALEKAAEIVEQGPDYARGLSQSIASASFASTEDTSSDITTVTSSLIQPTSRQNRQELPTRTPAAETASADIATKRQRFAALLSSY